MCLQYPRLRRATPCRGHESRPSTHTSVQLNRVGSEKAHVLELHVTSDRQPEKVPRRLRRQSLFPRLARKACDADETDARRVSATAAPTHRPPCARRISATRK